MTRLSLLSGRTVMPAIALLLALTLAACSTTEEAADATADTATDVANTTADVASEAYDAVTDAAGTVWNSVTDLFDDDSDADAAALLRPTSGNSAQGTVKFYETDDGLRAAVSLRDLSPGAHGFHIHQNPSCANDAQAAGGHWDPHDTNDHGSPDENLSDRHAGDLGNVEPGADGTVETTITVPTYDPDEHDLDDLAVVVHAGRDDLETDPAGDAGARVACGVIESR